MMTATQIQAVYSTGLPRHNIEQARISAGKDLGDLRPAELAQLEDFHTPAFVKR